MKPFHFARLLKLAAFLMKLPKAKFDFASVIYQGGKPMMEALKLGAHRCGTTACGIGWMPAVFPRDLRWNNARHADNVLFRKGFPTLTNFNVAEKYFGLTAGEAEFLFSPDASYYVGCEENGISGAYRKSPLDADATAKDLARHIRKFVKEKQKEQKAVAA